MNDRGTVVGNAGNSPSRCVQEIIMFTILRVLVFILSGVGFDSLTSLSIAADEAVLRPRVPID